MYPVFLYVMLCVHLCTTQYGIEIPTKNKLKAVLNVDNKVLPLNNIVRFQALTKLAVRFFYVSDFPTDFFPYKSNKSRPMIGTIIYIGRQKVSRKMCKLINQWGCEKDFVWTEQL